MAMPDLRDSDLQNNPHSGADFQATLRLAASLGAGVVLAMATRSRQASEVHHYGWMPPREEG